MNEPTDSDTPQDHLLVPLNIEALVVPPAGTGDALWMDLKPDFRKIKNNVFLGQELEIQVDTNVQKNLHKPGIHLHWALPDGLCHGLSEDIDEEPKLPVVPNRWLIIRFCDQGTSGQLSALNCKAWIVESDYVYGADESPDGNPVTFPSLDKEPVFDYVGKSFVYDQWQERHKEYRFDLTATGYGDPAFAAYYPASRGIFGFHDKDISDLEHSSLNYFVVGWYSDPASDPLYQTLQNKKAFNTLDEFLADRGWTYPGFDAALAKVNDLADLQSQLSEATQGLQRIEEHRPHSEKEQSATQEHIAELQDKGDKLALEVNNINKTLPQQILCHGIISEIKWKKDASYRPGMSDNKPASVAVGNTAIDALTALFDNMLNNATLAKLLEAFQYDLLSELEKVNGNDVVEQKVHERTFRPLAHGIRWELIQENPTSGFETEKDNAPPISGDIRVLLQNLNAKQREINRLKRERGSLKSELYASWYQRIQNKQDSRSSEQDLITQIERLSSQIAALEDEENQRPKGDEWDLLQEKLNVFLPGYSLQALDEPRFWRPNDPVILLRGEAFRRSKRHGEDGRFRSDQRLLCRLGGQEITALKMTIPNAKVDVVEFGPDDIDKWCHSVINAATLPCPQTVASLFREALFLTLNQQRCHDISVAAFEKNELGLANKYPDAVTHYAKRLFDHVLETIWPDAENSDPDDSPLRFEVKDSDGTVSAFEFDGKSPSPLVLAKWDKNPWVPLFLYWDVNWQPAYSATTQTLQLNDNKNAKGGWQLNTQGTGFDLDGTMSVGHEQRYSGTTLLTPAATLTFSDRLRRYNLSHHDPVLKKMQTAAASMNILCQSIGGLMDQFLMRKACLELQPLEPGATRKEPPQSSPIFRQVEDIDWLSPLSDKEFLPIRAGRLKLEKLWVIDAFGQLLQLEDTPIAEKNKRGAVANPFVSKRLASADGAICLDPRLAQATRLCIHWPPASRYASQLETATALEQGEEDNPVCGWILPNFLDSSLMIYDARGTALGALQAVQRKSWDIDVGSKKAEIESFHWIDIPGSKTFFFGLPPKKIEDPLGENANPHLRDFVKGLLSLSDGSGQAFSELLNTINDSGSPSAGTNPNLALLIGKPLALVRASLQLELEGMVATDQNQKDNTGGIEGVKFPVRLGGRRKWNGAWIGDDGLVGFFLSRNYTRFYPAYGLEGRNDNYSEYNHVPAVSFAEPLDLTLLVNPAQGVCATTGILPRKLFKLPYGDSSDGLENKQVVFFAGPVISPDSAKEIHMPSPSDIYGQWSWTHHPAVQVWREEWIRESGKQQAQFSVDPLRISDGWLKLVTAPLTIKDFSVKGRQPVKVERKPKNETARQLPAQFDVSQGTLIILFWSVTGADEIELQQDGNVLFKTGLHPLPIQYAVKVQQDMLVTLTVTDRGKQMQHKSIKVHVVEQTQSLTGDIP